MGASVDLIECQTGVVAGLDAICMGEPHGAETCRGCFKCSSAVIPGMEFLRRCSNKAPDYVPEYRVERTFPGINAEQGNEYTVGKQYPGWNSPEIV